MLAQAFRRMLSSMLTSATHIIRFLRWKHPMSQAVPGTGGQFSMAPHWMRIFVCVLNGFYPGYRRESQRVSRLGPSWNPRPIQSGSQTGHPDGPHLGHPTGPARIPPSCVGWVVNVEEQAQCHAWWGRTVSVPQLLEIDQVFERIDAYRPTLFHRCAHGVMFGRLATKFIPSQCLLVSPKLKFSLSHGSNGKS